MILEILIFIVTTLIGYYLYSYKQNHNYFKEKGVKFLPGVPLFGNLYGTTMTTKHFLDDLQVVYDAFPDEKYVGFFEQTMKILLIKDPELIKNITVKDFDHFIDHREFFNNDTDPLFAGSLLLMKGETWRQMRNTLSPAFTASKMRYMMPFILENTNNIIEYLEENKSQVIDVDDFARRYTNDVIASACLGLKINSLKDKNNDFYRHGSSISEFDNKQRLYMVLMTNMPKLSKKLGIQLFSSEVYDFFRSIVKSTMEYRKKEKVDRPDMMQLLMEAPKEWTLDELVGQVFIFFAAGFETSASGLVMAMHELALNPEPQEKLYQEIRKFNEQKKELSFESLSELKYLDAVIHETLRKWSPAIIMDRTCVKTYELPPPREGGVPYIVKPGEVVYNMVNCLHMDPKYYPEPRVFRPERFLDENKHDIQPFTWLPFGAGPRICIGMRFALMELKVLLYHIILNFKIEKTEKTMDPIVLKPQNFSIKAKDGSFMKFVKRE